jgi:uncharacterized glyoxalase superfamily protein PhnB
MAQVKAIPEGSHTLTPHITVKNADKAIEFYQKTLGAQVKHIMRTPDGKVLHASLRIGDSDLMLNDEVPGMGIFAPDRAVGFVLHAYVENVDDVFRKIVSAGATETMPLMDQFWGDRYGQVVDPFGFRWSLATHIKDLSPAEIEAAGKKAMAEMADKMQKTA